MNVAWTRLRGGHYIAKDNFAPVMIHLAELILQVKIFVYATSDNSEWDVTTQVTWASTAKLLTVCLLPTIDPLLTHKTGLVAALAKELGYDSAAGWYKTRVTPQRCAPLPSLPCNKPAAPELHYAA